MTIQSQGTALADIMRQEVSLLEEFAQLEKSVRKHIQDSDWDGLNLDLSQIEPITLRINELDDERHELYTDLRENIGESADAGFYQVVVQLSPEIREECSKLYRTLKLAVIQIQSITWSIDAHVRAVSSTIGQALDQIFPHRKGKIYSHKGTSITADAGPMLVNQSL